MNFNVNRPLDERQLAALYNNPRLSPQQVDSNMFMNSSQGHGYIQDQARDMGISDPAAYYAQKQAAAKMQGITTASNAARLNDLQGISSPNSMWGQLQERDRGITAVMDQQKIDAQKLAALQSSQRMEQYKLPGVDEQPYLSPVMQMDMQQRGIASPMQYLMEQRMGGMATPSYANGEALPKPVGSLAGLGANGTIPAGRLYNNSSFQNLAGRSAQQGAVAFEGMTGMGLKGYGEARGLAEKGAREAGSGHLRSALERGDATIDEKTGKILWRSRVPNPTTGKMEATGPYAKGDLYQQSLEQYSGELGSELEDLRQLAINRGDGSPAPAAAPRPAGAPPQSPAAIQAAQTGNFYTPTGSGPSPAWAEGGMVPKMREHSFAEGYRPVYNFAQSLKGLFGGTPQYAAESGLNLDNNSLAILQTPQFKEFQRREPAKARAWIMKQQEGRDVASTPVDFSAGSMY